MLWQWLVQALCAVFGESAGSKQAEKNSSLKQKRRQTLRVEQLEARCTPATVNFWTNSAGDGEWTTDLNWSEEHSPTNDEIATFRDAPGVNDVVQVKIPANVSPTIHGLDIQAGWTADIKMSGSTLSVTHFGKWKERASVIQGGNLSFLGQSTGQFEWSGGTFQALSPGGGLIRYFTIQPNAKLLINGTNANHVLDDAVLSIHGQAEWTSGHISLGHDAEVRIGGSAGSSMTLVGAGPDRLVKRKTDRDTDTDVSFSVGSQGTLNVDLPNSQLIFLVPFLKQGHLNISSGHVYAKDGALVKGSVQISTNSSLNLAHTSEPMSQQLKLDNATISGPGITEIGKPVGVSVAEVVGNNTISNLEMREPGTALLGDGTITLTGQRSSWSGGTWSGAGKVVVNPGAVLALQAEENELMLVGDGISSITDGSLSRKPRHSVSTTAPRSPTR